MKVPKAEIEAVTEKIYERKVNEMFQILDGYSVTETRRIARKEGEKIGEKKAEKKAYANKIKSAKYFISIGLSNSQISKGTGLTKDEIEELRKI